MWHFSVRSEAKSMGKNTVNSKERKEEGGGCPGTKACKGEQAGAGVSSQTMEVLR